MRTFLIFVVLIAFCGVAFAADVPSPDVNATDWLKALYTAATSGEWKMVAGLVMVGITFGLRVYGTRFVKWFASRNGGVVLNFVMSFLTTLGVAFASGAPIHLSTFLTAISTAVSAAGIWELLKSYFPAVQAKNEAVKAKASGVAQ